MDQRDAQLDEQIKGYEESLRGWPPLGVVTLCASGNCGEAATETGFCVPDEKLLVNFFADELGSLKAAAFASAGWFAKSLGYVITQEQAQCLRLAVLAEVSARLNPSIMLNRIPAAEVARMAAPHRAIHERKAGDTPENRERRMRLMNKLPRVRVADDVDPALKAPLFVAENRLGVAEDFRLRFAICCIGLLAIGTLLIWR